MPKNKSKWQLLIVTWIICLLTPVIYGAESPKTFHLVILHSNDFHGAEPSLLARQATLIRQIRAREPHVLALNAGDVFTRGRYQYDFYGEMEFAAMQAMRIDGLTLGNNEFKAVSTVKAQEYLDARLHQVNFPILCANVRREQNGAYLPKTQPYLLKNCSGVKVGIIGVTTEKIRNYPQAQGLVVDDPLQTAEQLFPVVAAKADIVLALTHIGVKMDRKLAKLLPGLAAIIGGDSHTVLGEPLTVKGVPIVQAGSKGKFLGRLDLYFELQSRFWRLTRYEGKLIRVTSRVPEDEEVKRVIRTFLARLIKIA
jgi:2',3'-cyclic-nucleotide 2'-phosphodiesterase (5'-nucleotidase family)